MGLRLKPAHGFLRPESEEEEQDAALRESLLQKDVESGPPASVERSWVSLFGTALVFVWPDDKWLKVRTSALHYYPQHLLEAQVQIRISFMKVCSASTL